MPSPRATHDSCRTRCPRDQATQEQSSHPVGRKLSLGAIPQGPGPSEGQAGAHTPVPPRKGRASLPRRYLQDPSRRGSPPDPPAQLAPSSRVQPRPEPLCTTSAPTRGWIWGCTMGSLWAGSADCQARLKQDSSPGEGRPGPGVKTRPPPYPWRPRWAAGRPHSKLGGRRDYVRLRPPALSSPRCHRASLRLRQPGSRLRQQPATAHKGLAHSGQASGAQPQSGAGKPHN